MLNMNNDCVKCGHLTVLFAKVIPDSIFRLEYNMYQSKHTVYESPWAKIFIFPCV